ncbi:hypothetical protein [Nocardia sp. NPDC005745]|uniref:hypothetical protein n=1 Tax=Nocardia sp. NPDC005745 TaxID=3157061 RepID=UPI0033C5C442
MSADAFEPSAAARTVGRTCRDFFMGLVKEGFTEAQALHIVGVMLSASIQGDNP